MDMSLVLLCLDCLWICHFLPPCHFHSFVPLSARYSSHLFFFFFLPCNHHLFSFHHLYPPTENTDSRDSGWTGPISWVLLTNGTHLITADTEKGSRPCQSFILDQHGPSQLLLSWGKVVCMRVCLCVSVCGVCGRLPVIFYSLYMYLSWQREISFLCCSPERPGCHMFRIFHKSLLSSLSLSLSLDPSEWQERCSHSDSTDFQFLYRWKINKPASPREGEGLEKNV